METRFRQSVVSMERTSDQMGDEMKDGSIPVSIRIETPMEVVILKLTFNEMDFGIHTVTEVHADMRSAFTKVNKLHTEKDVFKKLLNYDLQVYSVLDENRP
jgi:hypothetical protein